MTGAEECDSLWICIAAYNEATVIGEVVRRLRQRCRNIVVVDDGSSDDSGAQALAAGAVLLRHPINLGQGAALQTALAFALTQGAGLLVTFDADGQHRVEDIDTLLARHAATGAEVVLGSRFLGDAVGLSPARRLLLRAATLFTRLTTGMRVTDAHNGLRLFTRRAAAVLRLRQDRMAHASEILDQIRLNRLSYTEAPVTIVYTDYSLGKGQKLSNSVTILMEIFFNKLMK